MTDVKYIDHKEIEQALRNAHEIRSEEFHRVITSLWQGVANFFGAVSEGVQAGRKTNYIL